jgi:L-ribulose-5-phosphate 4-epimerase
MSIPSEDTPMTRHSRLKELRIDVLKAAKRMVSDRLTSGSAGNVSALDRSSGLIVITPSAVEYERMREDDLVIVDRDGLVVEGNWKPSNETPMHTIFYRERPETGAVMHTHAPFASVFSIIDEPIPLVIMEAALCLGDRVPVAPYRTPATEDLGRIALETMGAGVAVVLARHGLITVGEDLGQAYASSMAAELSAWLTVTARSINAVPREIDRDEVARLRKSYLENYRPTGLTPAGGQSRGGAHQ